MGGSFTQQPGDKHIYTMEVYATIETGSQMADDKFNKEAKIFQTQNGFKSYKILHRKHIWVPFAGYVYKVEFFK